MNRLGDDLDDDFVPDDLVALSDPEDAGAVSGECEEDVNALLSADEDSGGPSNQKVEEKKRKRRTKEKERKAKKQKLAESLGTIEPPSIVAQPPAMLVDYLSSMQAKTFAKMSGIELADIQIPESSIADTSLWNGSRNLDLLADFITKMLPTLRTRLAQRPKSNGAPTLVFIAGAALRVADVTRLLKDKKLRGEKGGEVAKLFAKHIKLEEHVTYLKRTKLSAAAGTPGRLGKLLECDALLTSALTHIILDISYRDSKKRNVLDIPETRDEVFKTVIGAPKILQGIRQGKIQLVLL
ncbi:U3-containing 90S pre-ribosomal complex subunit-domain containing protein [Cytidiella melzeri]|nr:U3-containing 90S pre-ribosomal complex subunit-domain containing protein [Cytidiella melzeri]